MARAQLAKELFCIAPDETGLLGRVTAAMALEGVYIVHLCCYSAEGKGYLQTVVREPEKAKKAIGYFIPQIEERDVLVVEFENKQGTLAPVAKLLGQNRIHVRYCYGTSGDGFKIVGVFSTSDNLKARDLINEDSQSLGV
ncbi:MAG TPA: hypothetical protein PKL97_06620 [Candidatus Omnitrophota bacterium]|nr:hypothetical protein [Candidatus Omnitrophota bacterium]